MSRTKSMKSQKNNLRQGFHHFNEDGPLDAWDTLQQNFESNQNEFNLWVAYLNSISFLYTVANFWGYKLKWDIKFRKHRWFSGRIIAFQAVDPGSIPGRCIFAHPTIFLIKITLSYYHLLSNSFIVFMLSNSSSYFKILKINQVSG